MWREGSLVSIPRLLWCTLPAHTCQSYKGPTAWQTCHYCQSIFLCLSYYGRTIALEVDWVSVFTSAVTRQFSQALIYLWFLPPRDCSEKMGASTQMTQGHWFLKPGLWHQPWAEADTKCCPVLSKAMSRTMSSCMASSGHEDITSVSVPLSQSLQVWSMGAVELH